MRYESEILYDLMKRDGLLNPSQDNLPYESELKEKFVNDVVGAYPKLQDYRPEWLNYNKCEYIPADFPTESQTNQTSGVFENVVPYVYERAILSGNTLVNIYDYSISTSFEGVTIENDNITVKANSGWVVVNNKLPMLKPNTNYTVFVNILSNTLTYSSSANNYALQIEGNSGNTGFSSGYQIPKDSVGIFKELLTTKESFSTTQLSDVRIPSSANGGEIKFTYMIIEGDHTQEDIPYFTGMQSVKMPVLTTSNEDGTKTNILTVNEDVTLRGIGDVQDTLNCLTGEVTQRIGEIVLDGSEGVWNKHPGLSTDEYDVYWSSNGFIPSNGKKAICDKLSYSITTTANTFRVNDSGGVFIGVSKGVNITNYLSENTPKINYNLSQESIKTVDLTIIDENNVECDLIPLMGTMHYQTSSDTIPPLADLTVCVEATTQNLASFVHLEGVEENE